MKVFKNLFGKGDKIHVNEIAYKDLQDIVRLLGWGVIVESGSSYDGDYIKLGDGTLMCWLRSHKLDYESSKILKATWIFPKPFMEPPAVIATSRITTLSARGDHVISLYNLENKSVNVYAHSKNNVFDAAGTNNVAVFAIGRWK